jgi:hypothetical protein
VTARKVHTGGVKPSASGGMSRRTRIILGVIAAFVLLCAAGLWYVNQNAYSVFGESGKAYGSSLARTLQLGNGRCTKDDDVRWYCAIEMDPGSGYSGPYFQLTARESGCWSARKYVFEGRTGRPTGRTTSGCVDLHDYVFPDTVSEPPR